MKFETCLLLGVILYGIWRTNRTVQRCETAPERNFIVRTSIFLWFAGLLVAGVFLFLPLRLWLVLFVPVFFAATGVGRLFREARARLRREAQERVDLERMKRVN